MPMSQNGLIKQRILVYLTKLFGLIKFFFLSAEIVAYVKNIFY